jgi:predicted CxxxxCH...CXXCH cytochrome family protein
MRDAAIVLLARRAALPTLALGSIMVAAAAMAQNAVCDPVTSALGAHPSHTQSSPAHTAFACTECHPPACSASPTATVSFAALAFTQGAAARWNPATRTCSDVYCHGSRLKAPAGPVTWAYVDPGQVRPPSERCAICHGYPPPSHSASFTECQRCHATSVLADGSIDLAGGHHIDGKLDFTGGGSGFSCDACHAFPPQDSGHLAHFGLTDAAASGSYGDLAILQDRYPPGTPFAPPDAYAFGCGNCHPLDVAKHMDGQVQAVLYDAAAPAGSLKARASFNAAYDPGTGTCRGTYCHSSGQESPQYVTTPAWRSGVQLGCDGCHANPPRYTTGAAGSATANTHLLLRQPTAPEYQLYGHFTWHSKYAGWTSEATGKHGVAGEGAAPMTCQTCHYATVDPTSTGPSGFYWLDTTGNYNLVGARATYSCRASGCHTGAPGGAPQAQGRVLPLRHVNGVRDVAFDPRSAAPAYAGLPPAPYTPDLPYWVAVLTFKDANVLPPGATWDPPGQTTAQAGTVSFALDGASYDPGTKTCSNVACHLKQTSVRWGGSNIGTYSTCFSCHSNH